jgi:glycosyltransferase involved in cell wall biosynthesis
MFSVVIPLYNKELSIKNTIQSVIDQRFPDFEIIVVNDGSTDESENIVRNIKDQRIRLINQKNKGVSAARNRGIAESNEEWIAFLDGDDIWKANHLEEIMVMIKTFPEGDIYATSYEYSDKRKVLSSVDKREIFKVKNYFQKVMEQGLLWSSVVAINRYCLDQVNGFNEALKYGEDTELWTQLAESFQIIKSNKVTAVYRIDAENRSDRHQDITCHFDFHIDLDREVEPDQKKYLTFLVNRRLHVLLRSGEFFDFFKLKHKQKRTKFLYYVLTVFLNRFNHK